MTTLIAELTPDRWLDLTTDSTSAPHRRQLDPADFARFRDWSRRYHDALGRSDQRDALRAIGCEIYAWLDGDSRVLTELSQTSVQPPLRVEFTVVREPDVDEQAFLDAPWELLADQHGPWALRDTLLFCPVRRLGRPATPPEPAPHRLSAVFMAASPEGLSTGQQLDFELEEAAILRATDQSGVDLIVEESGTLRLLEACVAREKPDVVHVSCHGRSQPAPGLLLEDEFGDSSFTQLTDLRHLTAHPPRLLLLSACQTAESDGLVESLARGLARRGVPAVLGWSGSVRDREATLFAAALYRLLAEGMDLVWAVAEARLQLAASPELGPAGARDWHLARLYLAPTGGGVLATAGGPRRHAEHGRAVKTFLDLKGKQVPVAGEYEFVGRRRQLQQLLRQFRAAAQDRPAGVLIHGLGRQGKSSLAARAAQRLHHTHELVVVFGRYDASYILEAFREFTGRPAVTEVVQQHRADVSADPGKLFEALVELLASPCRQEQKDSHGKVLSRPVLLVIDDLEQALDSQAVGKHRPKPHAASALAAVIKAFRQADTESRLLLTSRYEFTLREGAEDLAQQLFSLDLVPMRDYESRKQAAAKQRAQQTPLSPAGQESLHRRLPEILDLARGNPGLQDLLFSLALQDDLACGRCLQQMQQYLRTGQLPAEQQVLKFLEDLAVGTLLALLTLGQRELLRASTLFQLPTPLVVLRRLAERAGLPSADEDLFRLVALSLWEVYPDLFHPRERALGVNPLVRPQAGFLSDAEQRALATTVVADLFEHGGGAEGGKQRSDALDHEIARLAALAGDARILAVTAADGLRFLQNQFRYREATALAKASVAILDAADVPASVDLLRTAAERCQQVGEVQDAGGFRERALAAIAQTGATGGTVETVDHAATLIAHARALIHQGQPDEALKFLDQAKDLLPPGREQAIVLGDIARIRASKGEVDAALALHQEQLKIMESLGDTRSRAVTLGDIARIRADKGEADAALALHQERLQIFVSLGDQDGIANTLWSVPQIELQQERYQDAYEHLAQSYSINLKLKRLDGICFVGLDLGQLLCQAGQRKEGLQVLARSRDGFLQLGQAEWARQAQALIEQMDQ